MKLSSEKKGIVYAVLSYLIWGLTPIYWKLIQHISSEEILAQRIFWSFVFMLGILLIMKKWCIFISFIKEILGKPRLLLSLCIASVLISANWGIFMWAVIHGRILEASLGQYIIGYNSIKRTIKQNTNLCIFISRNWCIHLNVSLRRGSLVVA